MSTENKDNIIEEVVELPQETEKTDTVKIAPDVIATIAGIATQEIKGVSGMCNTFAGGLAEKFGAKKNPAKGIKVEIKENSVSIDLYIIVEFGIRIPELAWEIQESVKNSVETMTGLLVDKVNVHIDGISFKKYESEAKDVNLDDDELIIEETILEDIPEDDEKDAF